MTQIIRTRSVTDDVTIIDLGCGHRLAMQGAGSQWPLGRIYDCPSCRYHEPTITAVLQPIDTRLYTMYLSCGHFCQLPYPPGLTFAILSQLLGTQQYCRMCMEREIREAHREAQ